MFYCTNIDCYFRWRTKLLQYTSLKEDISTLPRTRTGQTENFTQGTSYGAQERIQFSWRSILDSTHCYHQGGDIIKYGCVKTTGVWNWKPRRKQSLQSKEFGRSWDIRQQNASEPLSDSVLKWKDIKRHEWQWIERVSQIWSSRMCHTKRQSQGQSILLYATVLIPSLWWESKRRKSLKCLWV